MQKFFYPESIVVIGVSITKITLGGMIVKKNFDRGYKGKIYGVGSSEGDSNGVPVYTSIADLPEVPDVAIMISPAQTTPQLMEECGKKGIKRVVIESAGFSEFSDDNETIEESLLSIAEKYKIKFIGPNCLGVLNNEINLAMPFGLSDLDYKPGGVSIISQSGGIGIGLISDLFFNHINVGKMVSIGNKLQLDEVDFLEYIINDENTKIGCLYLEGIERGRDLFDLASKSNKPLVAIKSNKSSLSAQIAQSHSTSLSADDDVVDAAFRQSAVVRVEDEEEAVTAIKAFHLPELRGRRLAVFCRSGGHAVISADICNKYGFEAVPFDQGFIDKVNSFHEARIITYQNPMDLGDIYHLPFYTNILEEALKLDYIDGILFMHVNRDALHQEGSRNLLNDIGQLIEKYDKPIYTVWGVDLDEFQKQNREHPAPLFKNPNVAGRAMNYAASYYEMREIVRAGYNDQMNAIPAISTNSVIKYKEGESNVLLTNEALDICFKSGIPVAQSFTIESAVELQHMSFDSFSFPVVVKALSREASHKSDVGGVHLDIQNADDLLMAVKEMQRKFDALALPINGFLVQEMLQGGDEFFIGGRQDPVFGPIVIVGMGGIFVEVFKDRVIRLAPISKNQAVDMVKELKAYEIIKGTRGKKPLDMDALTDVLVTVSQVLAGNDMIDEIDLNPIMVYPDKQGVVAVDARIYIKNTDKLEACESIVLQI